MRKITRILFCLFILSLSITLTANDIGKIYLDMIIKDENVEERTFEHIMGLFQTSFRNRGYTVAERSEEIIKLRKEELGLQRETKSTSSALAMGELLGADSVVIISLYSLWDKYHLEVQIIDVESQKKYATYKKSVDGLPDITAELVDEGVSILEMIVDKEYKEYRDNEFAREDKKLTYEKEKRLEKLANEEEKKLKAYQKYEAKEQRKLDKQQNWNNLLGKKSLSYAYRENSFDNISRNGYDPFDTDINRNIIFGSLTLSSLIMITVPMFVRLGRGWSPNPFNSYKDILGDKYTSDSYASTGETVMAAFWVIGIVILGSSFIADMIITSAWDGDAMFSAVPDFGTDNNGKAYYGFNLNFNYKF